MKRTTIAALAAALLAPLALVACGGGDKSDAAAPAASQSTTEMAGMETHAMGAAGDASTAKAATDLRVTLDRLLGEHAVLAMTATQKGFSGAKDFEAIAAALDRNAVELADAIGSVYGDEARAEFLDGELMWRDHIGFFVDYTVGLAKGDKAMQKKAVGDLKGYTEAFSNFLATATGLPQGAVRKLIAEHVMELKGQIDAYAAGDYGKAYDLYREAYAHMFMTGDALAEAIVAQSPGKFGDS